MFKRIKSQASNKLLVISSIILLTSLFFFIFESNNKVDPVHAKNMQTQTSSDALINLSVDKTSFGAADNVILHVTITNPNNYPINILKWHLPSNGITEPLFTVSINGKPTKYLGVLSTRLAPTEQDYITLQAGEYLIRDVNVSSYYDFSASETYSIVYNVSSEELYADFSNGFTKSAGHLTSNELVLSVKGRPNSVRKKIAFSVTDSTSFSSCSDTQKSRLNTIRSSASTYASESLSYFNAGRKGLRYVTWFGVYDYTRYNTVKSNYNAISSAMDTAGINFDCSNLDSFHGGYCDDGVVAYVFPYYYPPYEIYLCGIPDPTNPTGFWYFPETGDFSQAGVVIHEMSHFYNVANTDDYVYWKDDSKSLAKSDPDLAIYNADSYRIFAENTPPITDPAPTVVSIVRACADSTSAIQVDFTVTFSTNVTGVDVNDFILTNTDVTDALISGVKCSGNACTVTIDTGIGNGTIRLDLVDNDSIVDQYRTPLGGSGVGNGNFTSGEAYTIAKPNKPDLYITDVTLIPAVPTPKQTFQVSITIKNRGNADATGNIYSDVYIDSDPSANRNPVTGCPPAGNYRSDPYTSLAPGESDTKAATITGGLSDSPHGIWAYVDAQCLIDEK